MQAPDGLPRIGMGCWAVGGPYYEGEVCLGYSDIDERTSERTLEAAYEAGIRLFDTADVYGMGRSERHIGRTVARHPDTVIVGKYGNRFDAAVKQVLGPDRAPADFPAAIEESRQRLGRDRIDIALFHINNVPPNAAEAVFDRLEEECAAGRVEAYGWSTDFPAFAEAFADRDRFVAVEHCMNVLFNAPSMTATAAQHGLAQIVRSPLAMGALGSRGVAGTAFEENDVRRFDLPWMDWFRDGQPTPDVVARISAIRELLCTGGRTLAQGALSWLLAASPSTIPVPGARTPEQARQNAGALEFGPLPAAVMAGIETLLARGPEGPPRER